MVSLLLSACEKETQTGRVIYKINFTTNKTTIISTRTSLKSLPDNLYSSFGDYVTSLTPSKFIAQIWMMGYTDTVTGPASNHAQMLQYIEGNVTKIPLNDPSRIVDFSNHVTIAFDPVIYGRVNTDNQFEDKQIDFKYFCLCQDFSTRLYNYLQNIIILSWTCFLQTQ
jgi:hypothetical protein